MDFYKITSKDVRYSLQKLPQLVFEVTDRCNLNCKYCGYSELYRGHDTRKGMNFPFTKAKLIIDHLYDLWKDDYSDGSNYELTISFYGGEPLMNVPFIKQTIDYLESLKLEKIGKICSYSLTTNAVLLDKYMDYLVEKDFKLLISLDGDEFAQSYRTDYSEKNSFDQVFRNIKQLQEKYPEYFKGNINFNSVLHNRNEVESVYKFIRTQFDKTPRIAPMNVVNICDERKDEFIKMYRHPVESLNRSNNCEAIESEMFMNAPRVARLANYILHQNGNTFETYNELYINRNDFPPSTGTCMPFSKKMYVTVNGKILPCERICQQFSLGHVHDEYVELNEEFVAERHNYYISRFAKQCANCASNKFCSLCVYQEDDLLKDAMSCPIFLSQEDLEMKNEDIFKFLKAHLSYYKRILKESKK